MRKLAIIGASGHGKVVADIARRNGYKEIVFLDDNDSIHECGGYPVIGKSSEAGTILSILLQSLSFEYTKSFSCGLKIKCQIGLMEVFMMMGLIHVAVLTGFTTGGYGVCSRLNSRHGRKKTECVIYNEIHREVIPLNPTIE